MQYIYYPEIDHTSLIMKETFYGMKLVPKKYHLCMLLKTNDVIEGRIPIFYKNKVHFVREELSFGKPQSYVDQNRSASTLN